MKTSGHTHTRIDGTGRPVVLIHGVGLDLTMWNYVTQLIERERTVVRYDIWGHGGSDDPPGERSLNDFVAQLLGVLDEHDLQRADVAGLSIGGLIARGAAARHPDRIGRLAILNTVYDRTDAQRAGNRERLAVVRSRGMIPIADLAIDRWFMSEWQAQHPRRTARVHSRLATTKLDAYVKAYSVFTDGDPLMPDAIDRINAPTLVMTGELDSASTPAMAEAMAARIPDSTLHIAPGLGHVPPIEDPSACAAPLLEFLEATPA